LSSEKIDLKNGGVSGYSFDSSELITDELICSINDPEYNPLLGTSADVFYDEVNEFMRDINSSDVAIIDPSDLSSGKVDDIDFTIDGDKSKGFVVPSLEDLFMYAMNGTIMIDPVGYAGVTDTSDNNGFSNKFNMMMPFPSNHVLVEK